jgi:hypothetical protein
MTVIKTPKPDAPAEEWGRLAVSIPGFPCHSVAQRRGMVGWLFGESADVDWPVDGLRAMFVVEKGVTLYQVVEPGGYPQHRMRNGRHEFIPDPDHPATAGWLLRMLGGEAFALWASAHFGSCDIGIGRACISYAAAYGRWPGGEE